MIESLKLTKKLVAAPFILSFVLLPFLLFGLFKFVVSFSDVSLEYQALIASWDEKKPENQPYQINQERTFVQKDIAFFKKGREMQLRLLADSASFQYDKAEEKTEVREHMKNVTCYMQEELYYLLPDGREVEFLEDGTLALKAGGEKILTSTSLKPMQLVRKMEAKEGVYHYKSDSFVATNVTLERFLIEGHEFLKENRTEKKLMHGVADFAEFALQGKHLDFKAEKLKATFYEL